jgi:tetrahydromethanopterin S-methyltransferase subunit C
MMILMGAPSGATLVDVLNSLVNNLPAIIAAIAAVVGVIASNRRAKEVKMDLAVAKTDLKADNAAHAQTMGEVKVLVNGNLDAEKKKNAEMRAKLLRHGIDPD